MNVVTAYTDWYKASFSQWELCKHTHFLGMISMDYNITYQPHLSFTAGEAAIQLSSTSAIFTENMVANHSDMDKVLYDIARLIHPQNVAGLFNMFSNNIHGVVYTSKRSWICSAVKNV
jgi:hypothetical protein